MPSVSPSPGKRPSINHRSSSTHSLSSSGKQAGPKLHRPHLVGGRGHTRTPSHGKNLSKLGRGNSSSNLVAEAGRTHQRKKSGANSPPTSPKAPPVKRNNSHVALPKNSSHANLRKNHSANALARNVSHPALKKLGLAPPNKQKEKDDSNRHDVFKLGDQSSDENGEEAQWEDSANQSPELSRNHSKVSTPARVATPSQDLPPHKPPDPHPLHQEKTSSPPAPSLQNNNNRSAPNLRDRPFAVRPNSTSKLDPELLQYNPRGSRAPPAMSTISARATPQLPRTNSSRSFTHIDYADTVSPKAAGNKLTPITGSSLADGGVSHFLTGTTPSNLRSSQEDGSDYDSPANFLPNYKPMQSQSPEKSKGSRSALIHVPSRTQQRLELQRRETMRAGATAPTTPPTPGMGFSLGSSASLHSRSGSRGRNRSIAGEAKALKRDCEAAARQLDVVRRFRNPVLESLNRLKDAGTLPQDTGVVTPGGAAAAKSRPQSRPQSRHGHHPSINGAVKPAISRSLEDQTPSVMASRSSSGPSDGKVQLARQGSHDDIPLSMARSKASDEGDELAEEMNGLSKEEAMIRRIWESREVYDRPPSRRSGVEAR